MNEASPGFGTVTVPVEDLEAVYQLLAERSRSRAEGSASKPEHTELLEEDNELTLNERIEHKIAIWDFDRLTQLANSDVVTAQQVASVLDVLATDPLGQHEYNRVQIVEHSDISMNQLTGMFTRIGRHFESNYGTFWWPLIGQSGKQFTPERPGTWYWLPTEIAQRWLEVRS